jgi:hypothetical protein
MKVKFPILATTLALVLVAVAATASATQAVAKPGFPAGTWIGNGVLAVQTETVAGLTTRTSGSAKFTLNVSKAGRISGKGVWKIKQIGSGSVNSRVTGVATVSFFGTPTDVRFKGVEVITTEFQDPAHSTGTTFTKKEPARGSLLIKKAGSCLVTGGHSFDGGTFSWRAALQGVTCR